MRIDRKQCVDIAAGLRARATLWERHFQDSVSRVSKLPLCWKL